MPDIPKKKKISGEAEIVCEACMAEFLAEHLLCALYYKTDTHEGRMLFLAHCSTHNLHLASFVPEDLKWLFQRH